MVVVFATRSDAFVRDTHYDQTFATALGLVAAIPAVIAYNKLSNDLARYAQRLEVFSGEFSAILSRQLDEED